MPADLDSIRRIGRQHGFPSQSRPRLWSLLLGVDSDDIDATELDGGDNQEHPDEKQVVLDTNRSFTNLRELENVAWQAEAVPDLKLALERVIIDVLRTHPYLHYYQGLHDIAQLLLVVCGEARAKVLLRRMSEVYLRDFMLSTLQPTTTLLHLTFDLLRLVDRPLHDHLTAIGVEPFFAIASLLTWWTHLLDDHEDSCRMFDYLLSSPSSAILYTIVSAMVEKRDEALACDSSDMAFFLLSKPPTDVTALLARAEELEDDIVLTKLPGWRRLSAHSCFRTDDRDAKLHAALYEDELLHTVSEQPSVWTGQRSILLAAIGVAIVAYAGARLLSYDASLSRWLAGQR